MIAISDTDRGTEIYRRTVTVERESEPRFRDLLGKTGIYEISFELGVGVSKSFTWPVDTDHGNARTVISGDPVNPTLTFRVEPLCSGAVEALGVLAGWTTTPRSAAVAPGSCGPVPRARAPL